jgi:hypothetical protein
MRSSIFKTIDRLSKFINPGVETFKQFLLLWEKIIKRIVLLRDFIKKQAILLI